MTHTITRPTVEHLGRVLLKAITSNAGPATSSLSLDACDQFVIQLLREIGFEVEYDENEPKESA